jgi:SAM-dependent methyltransferase
MAAGNASPDLTAVKERQQQMWATGDYAEVGSRLQIVSEMLCEAVDLRAGERVLDVATGSGNTALAAARRFCDVTAIDYVPALLERGRERAAAERLPVDFQEGDAERLDVPDASFDAVLSTFGQMFAPDQQRTASEMLRVCRSGGRIGMANWTPEGFIGEIFRTIGRHVPPPPGVPPPARWGTEEGLHDLFGDAVSSMDVARRTYIFRFRSPEHWLEFFQAHYGPTLTAFGRLDHAGQAELGRDILDVLRRFNRAGTETLSVPSEYLEVVAVRT